MEKYFAVRTINKEILNKCSSGGAFWGIAELFDGVICAMYDYTDSSQKFEIISENKDLIYAMGSKYIQSDLNDIFIKAELMAKKYPQKKFMFIGMGCQAAGFDSFVKSKGIRNRFFIVDIICHGMPSPKIWKEYATTLGNISYLTFKDKRNGWLNPTAYVIADGIEKSIDPFVRMYYDSAILRPSCYSCKFASVVRCTDMTIGDFWNIEKEIPSFYSEKGNSLLIIHTQYGELVWEKMQKNFEWNECEKNQCMQKNLYEPTDKPQHREKFWSDYYKKGINFVVRKYGMDSFSVRIKNEIKAIIIRLKRDGKKSEC